MNTFAKAIFLGACLGGADLGASATQLDDSAAPRTYGTSQEIILQLPAVAFVPGSNFATWNGSGDYVNGDGIFYSAVHLPNGALITGCVLYFHDLDTRISASLTELSGGNGVSDPVNKYACSLVSTAGKGESWGRMIDPPWTANNSNQYLVTVGLTCKTYPCSSYKAVDIRYRLQVSPAPAMATFGDVPLGHPFFRVIEALGASGITSGCGGGNFCPDGVVTRAQMAKFLANALGLSFPE